MGVCVCGGVNDLKKKEKKIIDPEPSLTCTFSSII